MPSFLFVRSDDATDDVRRATGRPQVDRLFLLRYTGALRVTVAVGQLARGDGTAPDDGRQVARGQHQGRDVLGEAQQGLDRRRSVGVGGVGGCVGRGGRLSALLHRSSARGCRRRAALRRQQHLTVETTEQS